MAAASALKADLLANFNEDDVQYLFPAEGFKPVMRRITVTRNHLNELYAEHEYIEDDIIDFCTSLTEIIRLANGPGTHTSEGFHPEIFNSKCAYLGTPPSSSSGCKLKSIHDKLNRFIDLITNTITAFFSRIASIRPELLKNDIFARQCIGPFANLIKALYYFAGGKIGIPFCYRLLTFVRDINIIFGAPPGAYAFAHMTDADISALKTHMISDADILVETSNWRDYICGRGIVQIECKKIKGRQVVAIHKSVSTEDDNEDQMTLLDHKFCGGARKTRKSLKRRKNRRTRGTRR